MTATIRFPKRCPSNRQHFTRQQWQEYTDWLEDVIQALFDESDKQNLSIADMARRSGVTEKTIYRLNGYQTLTPYVSTLFKLASAVGMRMAVPKRFDKPAVKVARAVRAG